VPIDAPEFTSLAGRFPGARAAGVRAIIVVNVERIADSCGYGVPIMPFKEHRPTMDQWSNRKGVDGIREYWCEKNLTSIDDLEGLDVPN
jgi:hypothetical protein